MYDIIGDIHGYSKSLKLLLDKLNYRKINGYYAHTGRKAIFVGDFIDRGPYVFETLEIVKSMVENGSALAIMGNHEYNAICFHTKSIDGKNWLRTRSQKNINQHVATLEAFNDFPKIWNDYINWFSSLPIYIDLNDFRVVHACWDEKEIRFLKDRLSDGIMDKEFLHHSARPGSKEFKAIESCLKGQEIFLPLGLNYIDVDGVKRNKVRVKWWKPINSETYRSIALHHSMNVPEIKVPLKYLQRLFYYPPDEVPVFIGHYWNSGNPSILSPNVCCVDYSIAKDEKLVAYKWNNEKQLDNANFVFQECIEKDDIY